MYRVQHKRACLYLCICFMLAAVFNGLKWIDLHLKSIFHSSNINTCNIELSLLTDMKYDYTFRLKSTAIKHIPDICLNF